MALWILRIDEKISKEGPLYIVADDEKEAREKASSKTPKTARKIIYKGQPTFPYESELTSTCCQIKKIELKDSNTLLFTYFTNPECTEEKEAKNKDEYKSLVLKHALEKSKVPQNAKKEEYKFDFK